MPTGDRTVSVLGLGLMGSARVAGSVLDACEASRVIVICLLHHEAVHSLMRSPEIESVLAGKVVNQLSTGSPADARGMSAWLQACGAASFDGAILGAPSMIGGDQAKVLVSGPRVLFDQHLGLFQALTRDPAFCRDEIGRAAALDHAALELSAGCSVVHLHAMARCEAESVPLEELVGLVTPFRQGFVERVTNVVGTGEVPSGNASVHTWLAWAETLIWVSDDAGVSATLPRALHEHLHRTVELGQGDKDFPVVYGTFRPVPSLSACS